mmetsp:Transcript_2838/g.9978  ORF Transcript_2838/g.9978 Transcript_2838/m.9978 type:complete len:448 (+) Transcript_2838:164-1507(+)
MQVASYWIDTRSELGSGTQGSVFQAIHIPTRTKLAAKITVLDEERKCIEFDKAMLASKRLNHPNVLKALAMFEKNSMGIVLMEKMAMDLLDYIQEHEEGKLGLDEAREIFRQICEGVEHCHDNHISHMDIKPENILVSSSGRALLADFGCCHDFRREEYCIGRYGTVYYCAPEVQSRNWYKAEWSDIWSLGVLLHVLITGHWPFHGDTVDVVTQNARAGNIMIHEHALTVESIVFLQFILQFEPAARPSIKEVLAHQWFNPAAAGPRDGYHSEDGESSLAETYTHTRTNSYTESTVYSYYATETSGSIYTATRTTSWSSSTYSDSDDSDEEGYLSHSSSRSSRYLNEYSDEEEEDSQSLTISSRATSTMSRSSTFDDEDRTLDVPAYPRTAVLSINDEESPSFGSSNETSSFESKKPKSKLKDTMTKSLHTLSKKINDSKKPKSKHK